MTSLGLRIALSLALASCLSAAAQTPPPSNPPKATQPDRKSVPAQAPTSPPDNQGERKFRENCNRCHKAPDELSPRITGTVLLHMRVRASLSAADEKAILHYLAP
jgi:cytochrome c5